jgi:hypothetical protein
MFVPNDLPPSPLLAGIGDSLGKPPSLLEPLDDSQANVL